MRRSKSPVITGWLPEDPDDPPRMSWRDKVLFAGWVTVTLLASAAIPDDLGLVATVAAYAGLGVVLGLALRLWAQRSARH